ncbi:unnamed protein product [Eruca vesicaria subsp. sativa]|uniref:Legume lectin domain-containing protein n=1 Tax=Eruca vesicaria subsp. sativa TaxID=29727 RepID=A0ABC8LG17_ERUVS|nr:unnamed protein product [Eruca vesicaria subsp. sativa]
MWRQWSQPPLLLFILTFTTLLPSSSSAIDFLYNNFTSASNITDLILIEDSRVESTVIRLINETNQFSLGRVFHPQKLSIIPDPTRNPTRLSSFSTSFVFSILPDISTSPGFGLCFVLSNSTSPPGAIASQNFGLFPNMPSRLPAPLLAVEFDTGLNSEVNDIDGNHVGIDLNSILSTKAEPAGYYDSVNGSFVSVNMRNGQNIHAWIDFDGPNFEINVTIAPAGMRRPRRPTLTYRDPVIANYVSADMFVGFSASKTNWVEVRRILAWSLSDTGAPPREINTTGLPVFFLDPPSSSLSTGAIAGIVVGCVLFICLLGLGGYFIWWKLLREEEEEEAEDWELEFWPHRFTYEDLSAATDSFSINRLLGSGGFDMVLVDWVRDLYGGGVVVNAADERVRAECDTGDEIELLLKLGLACCHPDPAKRPTMREIVSLLIGSPQEDLLTGLTPVAAVDTASPSAQA